MAKKSGMLLGRRDWDEAAQTWLDFVRKGEDYHRDELNNPATFELIGNTKGQTLLDMACGEGYNTRILARQGAEVVGIDFSEKMRACEEGRGKERLGISRWGNGPTWMSIFSKSVLTSSDDTIYIFMRQTLVRLEKLDGRRMKRPSAQEREGSVMNYSEAAFCGDYCGKCPNYTGKCSGCIPKLHQNCHFVKCCSERNIEHCGLCKNFPCKKLVKFVPDDRPECPSGYHIENLKLRRAVGTKAWLESQRQKWSNPNQTRRRFE